ncbi:MAG: pyruvate dehydrogenase [Bdellovibrionales bacterium]|nr:pyruvate dehydrogenase [Bdellovibrionales bacterium]
MVQKTELKTLNEIAKRAHLILNQMIYMANYRKDQEKGDPKVGGHCSASTSALHILGALHLVVKTGYDYIANKPHASPTDHAYNYLLGLLLDEQLKPLSSSLAEQAMRGLRAFPKQNEYTFQSYHSTYDPDHHHFLPSGTVGIPPVVAGYLALAYRAAQVQGYKTPTAHFWSIIGDSEFREGSLMEAIPDLAERELGNITWILDYNRQSLDGHRLINNNIIEHSDAERIERTLCANGWQVIQLKHGSLRKNLFQKPGGKEFQFFLEKQLTDHEFQALFLKGEEELKSVLLQKYKKLKPFLNSLSTKELKEAFLDLGGHDFSSLISAMETSKKDLKRPCFIIAHTIKGWGLKMAGLAGNHSYLISKAELDQLREGLKEGSSDFPLFPENSKQGIFLKKRKEKLYKEILSQKKMKKDNKDLFNKHFSSSFPQSLSLDFQKMSYPHTQWFLGQITARLSRVANEQNNALKEHEKNLKAPAQLIYSLSPDVGTSTNLGFSMNDKVFGPYWLKQEDLKKDLEDKKSPNLVSNQNLQNRFIRFEISEANSISCMAAFGKMKDLLGVPVLPLMTVYDFFIKRALDQYFYALYWNSSFILCGTPSGVTLSPEGAQHGWKSDFQIPNQITWEPFFLQEMDWIFTDALQRHFADENEGRTGVLIRAVTRGADQKAFLNCLKTQRRFKKRQDILLTPKNLSLNGTHDESNEACISDMEIFSCVRKEVLDGAYYLLNYRGYADYTEEDNVVFIFAMGSLGTEAITASKKLLNKGVYANLIIVTSPDLLLSNLAHRNNYIHLKQGLGLENTAAPIVSVHDGEPGLLDNIGSLLGTYHESLAVRKHSRCGRPREVYQYHGIDTDSIMQACLKVLQVHTQNLFQRNIHCPRAPKLN